MHSMVLQRFKFQINFLIVIAVIVTSCNLLFH